MTEDAKQKLKEWQKQAYLAARSDINPPNDHPEGIRVLDGVFEAITAIIDQEVMTGKEEALGAVQIVIGLGNWVNRFSDAELNQLYLDFRGAIFAPIPVVTSEEIAKIKQEIEAWKAKLHQENEPIKPVDPSREPGDRIPATEEKPRIKQIPHPRRQVWPEENKPNE